MLCEQLVFPDKHRCEVKETEVESVLAPGQVLVRNRLSLVSAGTELAMFNRTHRGFDDPDFSYAKYPFKPGYAAVGEVVEMASDVKVLKIGDRLTHSGHHAQYRILSADTAVRVPDGVADEDAVFLKMIEIAMASLRLEPVRFGETVAVIGMGIVGNLCAQLCKLAGGGIVAGADLLPERLKRALDCGVDRLLDLREKSLAEWGTSLTPDGPSLVVEAVGSSSAISSALKGVGKGGRIVLLGSPRTLMEVDPYYDIHRRGVRIIGAHGNAVAPEVREADREFIMMMLLQRRLKLAPLRSHTMPFREAANAYEGLRDHPEKYVGVILTYD